MSPETTVYASTIVRLLFGTFEKTQLQIELFLEHLAKWHCQYGSFHSNFYFFIDCSMVFLNSLACCFALSLIPYTLLIKSYTSYTEIIK